MAVVTHGKAWAVSKRRLEGRASPARKGAGLRTSHTGMGTGSCGEGGNACRRRAFVPREGHGLGLGSSKVAKCLVI
jgi:hypothetical protein